MSQIKKALPDAEQLTLLEVRNYKVVKSNVLPIWDSPLNLTAKPEWFYYQR